jgi:superoxide dismutase
LLVQLQRPGVAGTVQGSLAERIAENFGSFENFKKSYCRCGGC